MTKENLCQKEISQIKFQACRLEEISKKENLNLFLKRLRKSVLVGHFIAAAPECYKILGY